MTSIQQKIEQFGVIPVVAIEEAKNAIPLAEALITGGLPCAEITFRTAAAKDAIQAITEKYPDMLVGAGTVLSEEQAQQALAAGVQFIVTPGFDPAVVDWCLQQDLPIMPGVATPTEINMALNKGLDVLKFFPAEAMGGVKMLKAVGAPYGHVRFVPTGGVNPDNLQSYLELPQVLACGGSWLVSKKMINAGEFQKITALTKEAVQMVNSLRSGS